MRVGKSVIVMTLSCYFFGRWKTSLIATTVILAVVVVLVVTGDRFTSGFHRNVQKDLGCLSILSVFGFSGS